MNENRPIWGKRIKEARSLLKMSQSDLADRFEKSSGSTVSAWESGVSLPSLTVFLELSRLSGRPISWFFGEGEEGLRPREENLLECFRQCSEQRADQLYDLAVRFANESRKKE